jgi:N-acyl-D-aspartate/D-glutamate deacylase
MPDLLIRGGKLADGDGGPPRRADVRISGAVIGEVGPDLKPQAGEKVFDADGLLVTPGFVDTHTHYDGQATWDEQLSPSCWHGVTTVVMGNCGVGFAPVRPGQERRLIELMEGVEDIPGTALSEGMTWGWESFSDYLDALGRRRWSMDVGTHVPHAAVRAYVMGDRATDEGVSADELAQICQIVREGMRAGALGVSTSRMLAHRSVHGEIVPGTFALETELAAIAEELKRLGTGVFEVVPRGMDGEISDAAHAEIDWMGKVAHESGRPLIFSVVQTLTEPDRWRMLLDRAAELRQEGAPLHPQVGSRPTGIVFGLQSVQTPFSTRPSYKALADLPLSDRLREMKRPEVRARILAEPNGTYRHPASQALHQDFDNMFRVSAPIDWEPPKSETVGALAAAAGVSPEEYCYDYLLENDGKNLILYPYTNYVHVNLDDVRSMLTHSATMFGLGDGGAHCGVACDAGSQTMMLAYWARDRRRGEKIDLGVAVRKLTRDNAEIYGLNDRGRIAPGYRADLNVIDFENLQLLLPEVVFDLPAGARRIVQRAKGYVATFVAGERTIADDQATGARPGRLLRGPSPAPAL